MNKALLAHERLMATLPVRTHVAALPHEMVNNERRRRVMVDGRVFDGVYQAIKTLHVSSRTIYKMIDEGRAEYVK